MKSLKERKAEAKNIVAVLNSTGPNYTDPFPIGNRELYKKTMELYQENLISFNKFSGLWKVGVK